MEVRGSQRPGKAPSGGLPLVSSFSAHPEAAQCQTARHTITTDRSLL
jgi:hypothetical protein